MTFMTHSTCFPYENTVIAIIINMLPIEVVDYN